MTTAKDLERQYQRPIQDILIDAYEQHGGQRAVAQALGIHQSTLSLWLVRYRLQQKTILVRSNDNGKDC